MSEWSWILIETFRGPGHDPTVLSVGQEPKRMRPLGSVIRGGGYLPSVRAMIEEVATVLPPGSVFTRPRGGIFVWARLPDGWSATALLERAVERGIFFMPGSVFFADVADDVSLRLSISNHTPETISEGMGRLAAAIAVSPALAR